MAAHTMAPVFPRVSLAERPDFSIIGEIVQPGSRVLDLGCGEGALLAWLGAASAGLIRRMIAPTRASSSRGEKGLVI